MIDSQKSTLSAVERTTKKLRNIAFDGKPGDFLGSEEDVMVKLGVSRPTLRQAASLLAQEQLVHTRRGVKGGYFIARPSTGSVSRMAATYLKSREAKLSDVVRAVEPIRTELARLACRRRDPSVRQQFNEFLEREQQLGDDLQAYRSFLRAERDLCQLLGNAADNELLSLFLSITYDLAAASRKDEDVYVNRPDRVERYRDLRNQMVAAIADGDEELAVLCTRRCSAIVTEWMQEDMQSQKTDKIEQ